MRKQIIVNEKQLNKSVPKKEKRLKFTKRKIDLFSNFIYTFRKTII